MASSPEWKVYDPQGKYQAACKEPEAAAAIIGALYDSATGTDGATIRWQHGTVVWYEGAEQQPASDSYDYVAETCMTRLAQLQIRSYSKLHRELNSAGGKDKC